MIGLPFSPIFKPENVRKYFEIVWSEGDFYMLTWRAENSDKEVPSEFLHKLSRNRLKKARQGGEHITTICIKNIKMRQVHFNEN